MPDQTYLQVTSITRNSSSGIAGASKYESIDVSGIGEKVAAPSPQRAQNDVYYTALPAYGYGKLDGSWTKYEYDVNGRILFQCRAPRGSSGGYWIC